MGVSPFFVCNCVHICHVCSEGTICDSTIKVAKGHRPTENVIPEEADLYIYFK